MEPRSRQWRLYLSKTAALKVLFISSCFFMFQVSYDYWHERSVYNEHQQQALLNLEHRFLEVSKDLEHLVKLTSQRIAKHHNNTKQLQHILTSLQSISSPVLLPSFQRVLFKGIQSSQEVVTRFGVRSVKDPVTSRLGLFLTNQGTQILKTHRVQEHGQSLGWLFIEIAAEDFIAHLKPSPFLEITVPLSAEDLSLDDFFLWVKKKPYPSLGQLLSEKRFFYCQFFMYTLGSLLLWASSLYRAKRGAVRKYKAQIQEARQKLEIASEKLKALERNNHALQEEIKNQALSFTTHQELMHDTLSYAKKEAKNIHYNLAKEVFRDQSRLGGFGDSDYKTLFIKPLKTLQSLAEGIHYLDWEEDGSLFSLQEGIQRVSALFSYRIFKANITLEIKIPEESNITLRPYCAMFLLINLIGKPFHAVLSLAHDMTEVVST